MIKGKSPFPFQTIALAVSFSPGLPSLVAETKRLSELHHATTLFIHIGKKTGDKFRELSALLTENGFHDGNSRVYWEQGELINTILRICKHEVVDLLIAGVSDRHNFDLPAGRTVKELSAKAKCSILLFRDFMNEKGYKKIVVNGLNHKKTELTISTASYVGEKELAHELIITNESDGQSEISDNRTLVNDAEKIRSKITFQNEYTGNMQKVTIADDENLADFSFKQQADLIVTHSIDHKLMIFDRISEKNGIDNLLQKIPCSLLIVHSRIHE